MSKRVAIYARVSTTRQAENDISIPDQLAQAQRYCKGKGWHVIREFVDPGASARDDKRPEFQRMMDAACVDPSPFDVVLIHSQSRFFRDTAGYVVSKRRLQKYGVLLVSMTQDFGEGPSADFAETIIAASDALHSAETAKHVTRTMLENARQGFWNGAQAPFGYRTVSAGQRGQRVKKKLEIEPTEAETVRLIFKLFEDGDGSKGPMGVKGIVTWLNANGFRNRGGNAFYTSAVHKILTRETYTGTHFYNQHDSRARKERPKDEWVAVTVPKIIQPKTFNRVQDHLHQRRPNVTAPRVTSSAVLLTGLARCHGCGGPLMLGTGKSSRYRYYVCASSRTKGRTACADPVRIPMAEFDALVIGALADQLLTPERLTTLLREAQRHRKTVSSGTARRRAMLQKQLREADKRLQRLYAALAEGTVSDTTSFRGTVGTVEAERAEITHHLSILDRGSPPLRQALSNQQAATIAASLKRRLLDAPSALQRRYVRGLVSEIVVDRDTATISGPPAAIAAAISAPDKMGEVRTSVREWRARKDSNL